MDPQFLYETTEAPVADGGGVPDAAPDAGAPEPTQAAPDYGAMLSSPEGQQALYSALEQMGYGGYEEPQPDYGGYEEQQQSQWDNPFAQIDPLGENFGEQLGQGLLSLIEQNNQQLLQQISGLPGYQAAEQQQWSAWTDDAFGHIEQEIGSPINENLRSMAVSMAAGNNTGQHNWDPGRALHDATRGLHDLIQSERAAAVREYQEGLAGGGSGGHEPSANGPAAIHSEAVPADMRAATAKLLARFGD